MKKRVFHATGRFLVEQLEEAMRLPLPAAAKGYYIPGMKLLVAFCRQLGMAAKGRRFYLSCYSVERIMGVPYRSASRWLSRLVRDEVLLLVSKGRRRLPAENDANLASEYRYLGD